MLAQARQGDDDDNEDQANIPKMIDPTASLQGTPGPGSVVSVFNVIVVGQAGVGKTGFIKLLIDTSILSSDADMDADPDTHTDTDIALPRLARLAEFANYTATCPTTSLSCATADLAATNQRPRITLNLFDTPGLQFHDPQELERGVNLALRQITDAFGASQSQPALTAQERADKQIHLCLYLLDPADIVPSSTRHLRKPDRYGVPIKQSRQRVHLAAVRNVTNTAEMSDTQHYDDGDEWGRATVPKAELRVIRRLSEYVTVLPVVAKVDTLTIERLHTVKSAVRRDFLETGLSFAPFQRTNLESGLPATTPPPDVSTTILPYAIMLPERYHHGDGVARTGTAARPSHQHYMTQYRSAQVMEGTPLTNDGVRAIHPGEFVRSYPWGVVDVLDPSNSDFLALRGAILGSNVQLLRSRSLNIYLEAYKRGINTTPILSPALQPDIPPDQSHKKSFSSESISGPSQPPLPSLPPTSLFSYQTSSSRSSYHQDRINSPGEYSLPPLEIPTATGSREKMFPPSRPAPLAPISAVLNPPLKHVRSAPALVSPKDERPYSPLPSPAQPSRQRTGRKIAVACNFCRSRKLKCDGGRPQCIQCMRRTVDCEYEPAAKRRGLGKHSHSTSHPKGDTASNQPGSGADDENNLPPKSVACQFCRARKTRCDGLQPRCSNCEKRNQECIYLSPPTLEEEIVSMASRTRASSGSSITQRPLVQSPVGHGLRETLPSASTYRNPLPQPQPQSYSMPRRHPDSPISRTTSISSHSTTTLRQPDVDPYSRFGQFATPTSMHSASDLRRSDVPGNDSHSWRDRGSISSSSTRGGLSATPSSPAIKRKASYFGEEEGRREEFDTSPSPSKRRRLSGVDDMPYRPASSANVRDKQDRPPPYQGDDDEEERKNPEQSFGKRGE